MTSLAPGADGQDAMQDCAHPRLFARARVMKQSRFCRQQRGDHLIFGQGQSHARPELKVGPQTIIRDGRAQSRGDGPGNGGGHSLPEPKGSGPRTGRGAVSQRPARPPIPQHRQPVDFQRSQQIDKRIGLIFRRGIIRHIRAQIAKARWHDDPEPVTRQSCRKQQPLMICRPCRGSSGRGAASPLWHIPGCRTSFQ